ncbi:MAG: hypothetical protein WBA39_08180 [Rivularia sp. (in: cyanobacteria)]
MTPFLFFSTDRYNSEDKYTLTQHSLTFTIFTNITYFGSIYIVLQLEIKSNFIEIIDTNGYELRIKAIIEIRYAFKFEGVKINIYL